ncbi:MAG: S46 family peptidase [Thermomonas sp.]|uniref:S46 family peptidase n=1 Tax=Thermomonas sp. TaxID=1971895 RepID=UPI002628041D|nr:S46 family peptidase [Thermomonas sp.]MCC7097491.1 S46 family peptidase [Thermomonas sp.]
MKKTLLAAGLSAAILSLSTLVQADEGMWVPQQLPEIAGQLKQAGLRLDPRQLADLTGDPMGAVVSLGGCTASFVSPQGLVATNHHCAYGAIQLNSTAEKNLIRDGFSAPTLRDELSAGPNARIYVLESITDVTEQARAAIASAGEDPVKRVDALEAFEKKLTSQCEAEPGYRCRVYSFMGGNTYRLFRNIEIRDVRLAYAPPSGIGKFGGDIDNWMWPRHTGDFSFYRAYVGKDGKPAAFSPDNVPYQPKHWLKIADRPLGAGDFVMVAGYPGRTDRYATVAQFENTQNWTYPTIAQAYRDQIALVEAAGKSNPEIAVKYAANMAGWNNTMKNFEGQLEGFRRNNVLGIKQREEAAVLAWLATQGQRGKEALEAHTRLVSLIRESARTQERNFVVGNFNGTGLIGSAVRLYRLAIERQKPDAQRESGYQDRDLPMIEGGLRQMDRRYDPTMDRQLQAYWLNRYVALPSDRHVAAVDGWLGGGDRVAVERALSRLDGSKLGVLDERLKWLRADKAAFEASDDPAIRYAVAIMPTLLEMERQAKTRTGEMLLATPRYLQAVADYRKSKGEAIYPDANSSLRITFGHVRGYTKLDGSVQTPFTLLEQVAAKSTGSEPFDSPQALLDAVAARRYGGLADDRLGTVPVNFLSDLDITGGNSGSPVLDADGRLVGLAFDGTLESVASNWVFDPVLTRMISVDQRYMRWVMQEVMPAPRLLQEMRIPAK